MNRLDTTWTTPQTLQSAAFRCGYCTNKVASISGYGSRYIGRGRVYICPHCNRPTTFLGQQQIPGPAAGESVGNLPDPIEPMLQEARASLQCSAPTCSAMACRKILMHIAVNHGADKNLGFVAYVDHLLSKNLVPASCKNWVDHIRKVGNLANHDIKVTTTDDAAQLLTFTVMLLKIIYDYPSQVNQATGGEASVPPATSTS